MSIDNFRCDHTRRDGYHPYCKDCQRELRKRSRNEEGNAFREGEKRRHREYVLRLKNRLYESLNPTQKAVMNLKKYHENMRLKRLSYYGNS